MKIPVRQKGEFKWRNRAFYRHFGDIDHDFPTFKPLQRLAQFLTVVEAVISMYVVTPTFPKPFDFVRPNITAGGHDQDIVVEFTFGGGGNLLLVPVDIGDIADDKVNPRVDELPLTSSYLARLVDVERNK